MEQRILGRTGVSVSAYCLGAMMFGKGGNPDHDECIAMIHRSLDAGINFIDTADVYSGFESEAIIAKALQGRRDSVVLATKFFNPTSRDVNHRGGSRRYIVHAVEQSLRRLETDYIDLYQMHRPDPNTDIEESLSALSDLVHQGKVRMIGSSAYAAEQIVEAQWASERKALERFRCEQSAYSIFVRQIERDVLPTCSRYGMGCIVYAPLNSGWLTGRYKRDEQPPEGTRAARQWNGPQRWDRERSAVQQKFDLLEALEVVASEAGISLTQLAMSFTVEHPAVTSTIIGPRTPEQLDDLLQGAEVRLETAVLDRIDELCPPGTTVDRDDIRVQFPQFEPSYRRRGRRA